MASAARARRSELAVPGTRPELFEKAARSRADAVFLDLEDAVAEARKAHARTEVVAALNEVDWGTKLVEVRVNPLDSAHMYRDVIEVVERCPRLDALIVPKVECPEDVYAVDVLLSQIERATGRRAPVRLNLLIETARGLCNVEAIARASPRTDALSFGAGDFAASTGARAPIIGGPSPDYAVLTGQAEGAPRELHWNDIWHYAQARVCVACRAHGLRPVDGPFGDHRDQAGFEAAARRAAALGFDGKWVIHPSQVEAANRVFSPSSAEIELAQRIVETMRQADREGRGAVSLDGRMLDAASLRHARSVLGRAAARDEQ